MTTTEQVQVNGVELQVTHAGDGPMVLLLHGFPELSYSWRHQIEALAAAGYHAVAPNQRGYDGSSRPEPISHSFTRSRWCPKVGTPVARMSGAAKVASRSSPLVWASPRRPALMSESPPAKLNPWKTTRLGVPKKRSATRSCWLTAG